MTRVLLNCNYKPFYGCDENCGKHNMVCDDAWFKCVCPEGKTGVNCNSGYLDYKYIFISTFIVFSTIWNNIYYCI